MASQRLLSFPRLVSLLVSLLVTLSGGTNYVYSAYAPQLGFRLHITHTKLNIIGIGGNVGVYGSGPLWGKIVDARGPRFLFPSAFILLLVGYSGIRFLFNYGAPDSSSVFYALVIFSLMTGFGGNAGLAAAVNVTAKNFPDKARASATSLVVAGFGLSAFIFSIIAHAAFAENISSFLLLLSLGTSLPMIVGFFLVRIIPLPASYDPEHMPEVLDSTTIVSPTSAVFLHDSNSRTPLLARDHEEAEEPSSHEDSSDYRGPENRGSLELSSNRDSSARDSSRRRSLSSPLGKASSLDPLPNVYGKELFKSLDFWLLCFILALLSGTGLMYINNVGSMSLALSAKGNPDYDRAVAARWQAAQVSLISIMNCSGRVILGLTSDSVKHYFKYPRSFCLSLVSFLFIVTQLTTACIQEVETLGVASAFLGLSYGGIFGIFPTLFIDWFGLSHFSENWGFASLFPLITANIFSVAFGRNLDAHTPNTPAKGSRAMPPLSPPSSSSEQCLEGRMCYVDSLYMTAGACALALLLSIWAGWKDWRRSPYREVKEVEEAEMELEED